MADLYGGQRTTVRSHFSPSPCSGKITFVGSAVLCIVGDFLSSLPTLVGLQMCALASGFCMRVLRIELGWSGRCVKYF